jgi:hypothetical protein
MNEMLIKITVRFHLIPDRINIKKTNGSEDDRGEGTLTHCWWKCKLLWPIWKSICRFLKEIKIEYIQKNIN